MMCLWLRCSESYSLPLKSLEVNGQSYKMEGLNKFTEYTVRVVAVNRYGPGVATENLRITTLSDGKSEEEAQSHIG